MTVHPRTTVAEVIPIPRLAITGMGHIGTPQVYPKHVGGHRGRGEGGFDLDMDGVGTIPVFAQLCTGRAVATQFPPLVLAQMQAKVHPAM